MAWDNPHGVLSLDEKERAGRLAKINAQAIAGALRPTKPTSAAERRAAERLAREEAAAQRERDRQMAQAVADAKAAIAKEHERQRRLDRSAAMQNHLDSMTSREFLAELNREQAQDRAAKARRAEYGSPAYLKARYGPCNYNRKIRTVVDVLGCTEEEAAQHLARTYKEDRWKDLESRLVEELLGHR